MQSSECRLHPLIHTLLEFNLAQDIVVFQRFTGFGNELPHTGHTFSVGLIIRLVLAISTMPRIPKAIPIIRLKSSACSILIL